MKLVESIVGELVRVSVVVALNEVVVVLEVVEGLLERFRRRRLRFERERRRPPFPLDESLFLARLTSGSIEFIA